MIIEKRSCNPVGKRYFCSDGTVDDYHTIPEIQIMDDVPKGKKLLITVEMVDAEEADRQAKTWSQERIEYLINKAKG